MIDDPILRGTRSKRTILVVFLIAVLTVAYYLSTIKIISYSMLMPIYFAVFIISIVGFVTLLARESKKQQTKS